MAIMKKIPTDRGLIKMILIIIAALLILSYFGINLRNLVNSPTNQDNVSYVATTSVSVWNTYLKQPATYLWNDVFLNLIWNPAIDNLTRMKEGQPTDVQNSAPTIPQIQQPPN